ncbi:Tol biopolymer transport system component [Sinorhizobium kostiense]|uniref:Tol biopolymer transport system component n=1 Tax=Sinorhizobium kostiense TaxID=76747 RepID=A0ABS4QX90_9HYPH|nr:PD40 domain-containing protein [Sinorhizobium kostiense]MBP2235261.1 Tol biopolymer transport system component [Sinorhizobium kostiense]
MFDLELGTTTRVSVDSAGGQANSGSFESSISADGRYVAFSSNASNLVAGDTNELADVFVHDLQLGTTTRVSVDSAGEDANGSSFQCSISADGRYVTFMSEASNLVAGGTNGIRDIFVADGLAQGWWVA